MESKNQFYKLSGLLINAVFILLFSSCKNSITPEPSLGNARILLVNSAASSSAINLYYTGNKLNVVPLVYGNTSGYRNITSGVRDVQVKANSSNTLLAAKTIHLVQDSSYSFFVFEANKTMATVIAEDDLSIPSSGNAKIKFANMSSGLSSADLLISKGPNITSSVSFGTIGSYSELKAGTYNLILRVHGSSATLLDLPNIRLDNGKIYTLWSAGTVNGTGANAVSVQTIIQ
ncbi:MAG: DUF4397 domain-containing protein [Janthinobacterium lividum]